MIEENALVSSVVILDISQPGKKCSHQCSLNSTNHPRVVASLIQNGKS